MCRRPEETVTFPRLISTKTVFLHPLLPSDGQRRGQDDQPHRRQLEGVVVRGVEGEDKGRADNRSPGLVCFILFLAVHFII